MKSARFLCAALLLLHAATCVCVQDTPDLKALNTWLKARKYGAASSPLTELRRQWMENREEMRGKAARNLRVYAVRFTDADSVAEFLDRERALRCFDGYAPAQLVSACFYTQNEAAIVTVDPIDPRPGRARHLGLLNGLERLSFYIAMGERMREIDALGVFFPVSWRPIFGLGEGDAPVLQNPIDALLKTPNNLFYVDFRKGDRFPPAVAYAMHLNRQYREMIGVVEARVRRLPDFVVRRKALPVGAWEVLKGPVRSQEELEDTLHILRTIVLREQLDGGDRWVVEAEQPAKRGASRSSRESLFCCWRKPKLAPKHEQFPLMEKAPRY